jgi:hypothetical protein
LKSCKNVNLNSNEIKTKSETRQKTPKQDLPSLVSCNFKNKLTKPLTTHLTDLFFVINLVSERYDFTKKERHSEDRPVFTNALKNNKYSLQVSKFALYLHRLTRQHAFLLSSVG